MQLVNAVLSRMFNLDVFMKTNDLSQLRKIQFHAQSTDWATDEFGKKL